MPKQTPQLQQVCKLWITVENTHISVIFILSSLQNKESKSKLHVMNQRSFSCQDFLAILKNIANINSLYFILMDVTNTADIVISGENSFKEIW